VICDVLPRQIVDALAEVVPPAEVASTVNVAAVEVCVGPQPLVWHRYL
jgi:hypothetical protein